MGVRADDAAGLLDRVRGVVPLIAERAATAEEQRKPDDDVIEALKRTGVFKAFVPKQYGGYEIDIELFMDIGVAVSEACASTGWITTFYMEHNWLLGMFEEDTQREIFTSQPYILAPGTVNPSGEATRHDDHYELTGRWQYGTGIVHADWALLSGRIAGEENPLPRMFLVPVDEIEVKDTWHVDGMAATGSRDIVARCGAGAVPPGVECRARGVSGRGRLPPPHPGDALSRAHGRDPCDRMRPALRPALPRSHGRASDVRYGQTPGRDDTRPDPTRECDGTGGDGRGDDARRGTRDGGACSRRDRPHARSTTHGCASPSPTSCGSAATSCATSSRRAAPGLTSSTTSCNASTATCT